MPMLRKDERRLGTAEVGLQTSLHKEAGLGPRFADAGQALG
jgi:hypothetical protein